MNNTTNIISGEYSIKLRGTVQKFTVRKDTTISVKHLNLNDTISHKEKRNKNKNCG